MRKLFTIVLLGGVAVLSAAVVPLGRVTLTGKNLSDDEKLAFQDMKKHTRGLQFEVGDEKVDKVDIRIARVAPSDKKPLGIYERRIVYEKGNIYIYGSDARGHVNAVYDFLKDFLGCRLFNISGVVRPRQIEVLKTSGINQSLTPAMPTVIFTTWFKSKNTREFWRWHNVVWTKDAHLGHGGTHAGQRVVPGGKYKYGETRGPMYEFRDMKFFDSHPEYFSLNEKGKRTQDMQLCYSNPELRDVFYHNLELLIKNDKLGRRFCPLGQEDSSGEFCYCEKCQAVNKKYNSPAGIYYDFMLDMSRRMAKDHPQIILRFCAYRTEQTLLPPASLEKLPANLIPNYCGLGCDFSKPYTHPNNKFILDCFNAWGEKTRGMAWQVYPSTYPRPVWSMPLVANLNRIGENFKIGYKHNVIYEGNEFGLSCDGALTFNELRAYLIAELSRKKQDYKPLIEEYVLYCYGKAGKMMLDYINDLEKCEADSKSYLRWNPDILQPDYLTAENFIRWEKNFDKMEDLVKNEPAALLAVRRARVTLDESLIAKWPYLTEQERISCGDLEKIITRCKEYMLLDHEERFAQLTQDEQKNRDTKPSKMWGGLEQYAARARFAGKEPVPAQIKTKYKGKKIYQFMPNRNKLPLDKDPAAAFGLCNSGTLPAKGSSLFTPRYYDIENKPAPDWIALEVPKPVSVRRIKKGRRGDDYQLYFLGAMKLYPDMIIDIRPISKSSNIHVGMAYDKKSPDMLFDVYISLAADKDFKTAKIDRLLVIPTGKNGKPGVAKAKRKSQVDAFL